MILIALAAVGFVVAPLMRGDTREDAAATTNVARSDAASIEREVRRYRAALRAGTVCTRCAQANPEGSRYCYECGRRIEGGRTAAVPTRATA